MVHRTADVFEIFSLPWKAINLLCCSLLMQSKDDLVLRGFNFCVIDEVDSILIDEARTPLIISGSAEKPSERYYKAAKIAGVFVRDTHYTVSYLSSDEVVMRSSCSQFRFSFVRAKI